MAQGYYRIIDLMLQQKYNFPKFIPPRLIVAFGELAEAFTRRLRHTTTLVADNVVTYMDLQAHPDDKWSVKDYPCISPPWYNFFIDARRPLPPNELSIKFHQVGWFVQNINREERDRLRRRDNMDAVDSATTRLLVNLANLDQSTHKYKDRAQRLATEEQLAAMNIHFLMMLSGFWDFGDDTVIPGIYHHLVAADEQGTPCNVQMPSIFYGEEKVFHDTQFEDLARADSIIALLAIFMTHVRNFTMRTVTPPGPPIPRDLLGRKVHRKPRPRAVEYKVLEIDTMLDVLREERERAVRGEGPPVRRHDVRGYYRTYKDHGMFGNPKLVGRFWTPPRQRGNLTAGQIVKDYSVGSQANDQLREDNE